MVLKRKKMIGEEGNKRETESIIIIAAESNIFPVHTHFPCRMKKTTVILRFLLN